MKTHNILNNRSSPGRTVLCATLIMVFACGLSGCSLGVMAGKLLFGDPRIKSAFRAATGEDLTKGRKSVLIVCSAPHGIVNRYPSIELDLVDRITRIVETRGVKVVSADDVAAWYDDRGEWGDFTELADEFNADFVMQIQLQSFTCSVDDSPQLLQGKAEGRVVVLAAGEDDSQPLSEAFDRSFTVEYPGYPVPRENKSEQLFTEGFQDRIAQHLAFYMYDHRTSETVY
jgi:hypothetical protein